MSERKRGEKQEGEKKMKKKKKRRRKIRREEVKEKRLIIVDQLLFVRGFIERKNKKSS